MKIANGAALGTMLAMHQSTQRLSEIQRERALSQLKSASLFKEIDPDRLSLIVDKIELISLHDSETLFRQQELANHMFLLSTGQIKLVRSASNGTEKIISLLSPGSVFAEAVIFSENSVYPVGAISIGDSSVWAIDGEQYRGELHRSTDACFAMFHHLTQRLYSQVADIERLTLHTASSRLIAYLLADIAEESISDNSSIITLSVPKNVIASRLSIVPSTFSRTLSKLSRDGLIKVNEQEIHLLDIASLREFTDDIAV